MKQMCSNAAGMLEVCSNMLNFSKIFHNLRNREKKEEEEEEEDELLDFKKHSIFIDVLKNQRDRLCNSDCFDL